MGCDNSCAFCIVPQVRGPEVSRPFDDIVAEVTGAGSSGRHRGHAARPERQLLRARHHPTAPAVRRAVAGGGGGGRDTTGALHEPPPEGPAARDDRGHGRDQRRVRAPPPALAVGQRPCARRHAPGLYAPSATSTAWPRRAPRCLIWRSPPTSSWGSRARPRTTSTPPWRWRPRPITTAPTPSSSRPDRARGPPLMTDAFVPDEVVADRFERLRSVVERSAVRRHQARLGRVEEVVVEGPDARHPGVLTGRTRQNKLVHFAAPAGPGPAVGSYASVRVTGAGLPPPTGRPRRAGRPGPPPHPHPGPAGIARRGGHAARRHRPRCTWRWWASPLRASRALALALARARADAELVSVDSMCVYRGMDIGTDKPDAVGACGGPLPPPRPGRPGRGVHRGALPGRCRGGVGRHRRPGPARVVGGRHGAVPPRRGRPAVAPGAVPRRGTRPSSARPTSPAAWRACTPG